MAASPYSIETVDLSVATTTPRELVKPGRPISSVAVLVLAEGAQFLLHIGSGGPGIPCVAQGFQMRSRPRRDSQGNCTYPALGLYASVPSTFSATALLLVTYGDEGMLEISGGGTPGAAAPLRVMGSTRTTGSVNGGPVHQIQNPVGSAKVLRVLHALYSGAVSPNLLLESTAAHLAGAGATIITGVKDFMDTALTGAIVGVVQASNFANGYNAFNTTPGQFLLSGTWPYTDLLSGKEWLVSAGKALEVQCTQNGAGVISAVTWIWEE